MFCNKFPFIASMLHLSLAKILRKVLNFIISPYLDTIEVELPKCRCDIIPLENITEENLGDFDPSPWLRKG